LPSIVEPVDGGTIFLDEIGEMPLDTQTFLLRILESGEFLRMGSNKLLKTDVRVIAATNVDLEERVRKGKFREDLFYRLNTVMIKVPSLKERPEDIHVLFRKFASDFAEKYRTDSIKLDEKAQLLLENYTWKGNIRELKNLAERMSLLSEERIITAEALLEENQYLLQRNLPTIPNGSTNGNGSASFEEREILYKLLFDMKNDLNDLKSLVFELIKRNDLEMPDIGNLPQLDVPSFPNRSTEGFASTRNFSDERRPSYSSSPHDTSIIDDNQPIIIENPKFDASEEVEETLTLEDMEKQMIAKALKKYKGRRKEAAAELDISERTLYRKIKAYDLT